MSTHRYRQSPPDDDDFTQGILIAIAIIGAVAFVFSDGIIHILGW